MLDAELVPKGSDECPDLMKPHTKVTAVLAQQARFDELGPSEVALTGRLSPDHRQVLAPSPLATV